MFVVLDKLYLPPETTMNLAFIQAEELQAQNSLVIEMACIKILRSGK